MELNRPIIADTDYLSDFLAGKTTAKKTTFNLIKEGRFVITTTITVSELYYGKYRRKWQERRSKTLEELISALAVLPFTIEHAKEYGKIRASLIDNGLDIGFADTAIASIAIIEDLSLLTANVEHFNRIEGLKIRIYK
ncbi:MAG: type II toxin-antitoxin system VapC family toxin [Candidatus Hodarchaeales archaeon]|jgi:predicted nucleic acid-binding protein